MTTNLNVAMAPKDSTFQVRINSEIKKTVEDIYAKTGMTLLLIRRKEMSPHSSRKNAAGNRTGFLPRKL